MSSLPARPSGHTWGPPLRPRGEAVLCCASPMDRSLLQAEARISQRPRRRVCNSQKDSGLGSGDRNSHHASSSERRRATMETWLLEFWVL